jgi:hypothetical protein
MEVCVLDPDKGGRKKSTKRSPNVNLEASAKMAAIAKYEVKKTVHEIIPEDVTRAKAGAWLTLISPINQWAGLKGDALANKRALLRLQQEDTLAEIAVRARARINALKSPKALPNKFIFPLLEKASLEEPDSDLINLWANLLASAAEDYQPHYVHFANIISQISSRQAKIFTDLIGTSDARVLEISLDLLRSEFDSEFMKTHLVDAFNAQLPSLQTAENVLDFLDKTLNIVGTENTYMELTDSENKDYFVNGVIVNSSYEDELETDYAILAATGLIRYADTGFITLGKRWGTKVLFYYITPLGSEFAKACGIVGDKSSSA